MNVLQRLRDRLAGSKRPWREPDGTATLPGLHPHLALWNHETQQWDAIAPTLRPCHVTGLHVPDHHLRSDAVCDLQAHDIAKRVIGDLAALPRELHPHCHWCGTAAGGQVSPIAPEHAAWAATLPKERP